MSSVFLDHTPPHQVFFYLHTICTARLKFRAWPIWERERGLSLPPGISQLKCVLCSKTGPEAGNLMWYWRRGKGQEKENKSPTEKLDSFDSFTLAFPCQSRSVPEMKLSMDTFRSKLVVVLPLPGRQELMSQPRATSMEKIEMRKKVLEYWR